MSTPAVTTTDFLDVANGPDKRDSRQTEDCSKSGSNRRGKLQRRRSLLSGAGIGDLDEKVPQLDARGRPTDRSAVRGYTRTIYRCVNPPT